ncbi:hypothetical protein NIES2135_58810 [Leptolyngbya boryana NIES-2135]|jgi:hypothetical protein|uniref:Uncharacterized protein n=1 Tax=Leptolyngbya boryana NIES-2135 TaxID=1973484 RepID=A0A1Z4JQF3_LEPBY|nr:MULTISPECIES: hypothetical protein [Leptolyngbya]BAY59005.1 hypothetical protein NIES2135_58810 [Leptolyngbya boryana NIES-2135]MBD2368244.1 hypothetical protein [Leptolyngbya sp. FACHB-161]MBD2374716.1 hypothetical protein [Leptolyngbya sp. FACHB-238]MBD2399138.1 hypothetical protein [Leptolyngbya sp. FACHB-239]MBD2405144.1 hypothetical protein [Leptolyngbya sp. FACHB-402]
MPIDQIALIQTVYDTIFSTLVQPPRPGAPNARSQEMLLTLEWPGQQLDASQYQNPWTPQNPNGSTLATEMFSALIDAIPLVDATYVDSGVTVEEMYEFALAANAIPLPPDASGQVPPNPVNVTLQNARQLFEHTKMASVIQPVLSYRPSYATPGNWCDEAAMQTWTQINVNSNQTKKIADSPFVRVGGAKRIKDGIWKLPKGGIKPGGTIETPPIKTLPIDPEILRRTRINPRLDRVVARPLNTATLATPAVTAKQALQMQHISPNPMLVSRIRPDILEKIKLRPLEDRAIDTETKDLNISFRCCRVNFSRPWLLKSLLEITGWTLPGQAPGSLSSGKLEENFGSFPLLPIGFIAVRDLKISANWSKVDREFATQVASGKQAIGFGPFSLSGNYAESGRTYTSSFDGVTISSPGLQILGWINLVIPFAPPA